MTTRGQRNNAKSKMNIGGTQDETETNKQAVGAADGGRGRRGIKGLCPSRQIPRDVAFRDAGEAGDLQNGQIILVEDREKPHLLRFR